MRALWEVALLALPPRSDWMSSVQWFRKCFFKNSATFSKEKTNVLEFTFTEFHSSQALLTVEYGKIRFRSCILTISLATGICDKWLQNVLLSFFLTTRARRPALQHDCIETDGKDTTKKEEWQNEQPTEDARSKFSVVQHQKRLARQKFLRICT